MRILFAEFGTTFPLPFVSYKLFCKYVWCMKSTIKELVGFICGGGSFSTLQFIALQHGMFIWTIKLKLQISPYFCDYKSRSLPDTHYSAKQCLSNARNIPTCLSCRLFFYLLRSSSVTFSIHNFHRDLYTEAHAYNTYRIYMYSVHIIQHWIQVYRIEPICFVAFVSIEN